jgi:maltose/moltooligosaccharide transporter
MSHPTPQTGSEPIQKLKYTRSGLMLLFFWLLWGDFCFTLMEQVIPSILPLELRPLGASNSTIALILTTMPSALNFLINPVASFRSDRCRSRWGRRIPFMAAATPVIAVAICGLGFAPEIGKALHAMGVGRMASMSPATVTVVVIGILVALFRCADIVVKVFYYLFNDVVPTSHLGRFLTLFQIVGTGAGALYNYFIFPHALSHGREIFVGVALLYLVGFGLMCWRVKEPEYPPPPEVDEKGAGFLAAVKTYLKECSSHRLYLFYFIYNAFAAMAGATGAFMVFFYLALGLDLQKIGSLNAFVNIATMVLLVPAGFLVDRYHPVRVMVVIKTLLLATLPLQLVWLFSSFDASWNFRILCALTILTLPLQAVYTICWMPFSMRLLPQDRYGQFCSANAAVSAIVIALSAMGAGFMFDFLGALPAIAAKGSEFSYRFLPVWQLVFTAIAMVFLLLLRREWLRHGGSESYTPPDPMKNAAK